ncbi:DUF721 domain-containing protein [Metapseudomonas furukawaii]|jgi:hypothetical protein|uniref:DUF721 domain-containing protein n=1 Tax=Metapseudomonas furukawaii TaxID=1149133 RepID=UPI0002EFAD63|nr:MULTISPECIES: DciA family protein [Pseudomonas]OWJ94046.1 RNA-binding protein [Pseudomonas sp. A46]
MAFRPLPARSPASLLREEKPLRALFTEAQRIDQLQQLLASQLQPAAREHCHVAAWRDGRLLLIVTDGHWATRLRYQQTRLLRQLKAFEAFFGLERIVFKVQPTTGTAKAPVTEGRLSSTAAESLQATAETVSDPRLRAALERLARHGQPKD